jgi:cytochrome c556
MRGNDRRLDHPWRGCVLESARIDMRHYFRAVAAAMLLCAGGCSRSAPPEFQPTATVKDIMDSIVDPNADFVWDSVEVVVTLQGTEEKSPKTDEDWKALRRHAISLLEASNLLLVPGRHIARPGEKAEDERVDLTPEEIQTRVDQDRAAWTAGAHELHDATLESLKAIEAKDVKGLLNAGDVLDQACETCHRKYWYRVAPTGAPADAAERPKTGS